MYLFSIFDKKACKFDSVMSFINVDVAKRSLVSSFNPQSVLVLYPADYRLVLLASFNELNGNICTDDVRSFEILELIPDKLKQYALDGSFK